MTYTKDKTTELKIRISPEEKEQIKQYCKKHTISMSEFIRMACLEIFNKEVRDDV